jgi:hypothetical protein
MYDNKHNQNHVLLLVYDMIADKEGMAVYHQLWVVFEQQLVVIIW